jgi:hypothetical protein
MNFIKSVARGVAVFFGVIIVLVVILAALWPSDDEVSQAMDDLGADVARDFVSQYEDAAKYGDAMDRCVRAGFVAEGYLQAGLSEDYGKWKGIEEADCNEAGLNW